MDRGVHVSHARIDTGAKDRHIEEGRADIDDDLNARLLDQSLGGFNVQSVQRMRFQFHLGLEALLFMHAIDNLAAFLNRAGRNMDIAQYVRVLRTFMCNNLCHAPGADNENVLLHFLSMLPLPAVTRHLFRVPGALSRGTCLSFTPPSNTATQGSGERTLEIRVIKFADNFDRAVEFTHGNGWHFHAIKPVLLDHRITGCIFK